MDPATAGALIGGIYSTITTAEDIRRHGKIAIEFLQNAKKNVWEKFFPGYDYNLVKENFENFKGITLHKNQAIEFLELLTDEECDAFGRHACDYSTTCELAIYHDIEDMGEIYDGAFTEESMWGRIRYEIARGNYWKASDELGEYFDANFEEPPIEYQEVRTPWEED
tara:strand:- start:292 stop:792 length:501 start_codon:yes stop_codon:yes gene_type:complete